MGLFRKKEKRAETENGVVEVGSALLTAIFGGETKLTKEKALQIPTLNACITLIADKVSSLPVKLYRKDSNGEVEEITDDPRVELLNGDTGDTLNATELRKRWVIDYYLGKGSYTYIKRDASSKITGLYYVDEKLITINAGADPIFKEYTIICNGKVYFPYEFLKILRNHDGKGKGVSIVDENSIELSINYNTMKFENSVVRKGGNKKGFLKSDKKLSAVAKDELRAAWAKMYANTQDSSDNVVILNDGVEFQESTCTSVELQLNQNKLTNAKEICKLFLLPSELLSGNASETAMSQATQNCFATLINIIEAALDADLLYENEKKDHYWAIDTAELTRGDFESRMRGYELALKNNVYQLDEIRKREDLPDLGFNYIKLGLQDVLLDPKTMQIYTPNTKELVNLNGNGLTKSFQGDIIKNTEPRANPNHDKKGRFTFGTAKLSRKEYNRVSSGILTDHPEYTPGSKHFYEYGDYFYKFEVIEPGEYSFDSKIRIKPDNQSSINKIRKGNKK